MSFFYKLYSHPIETWKGSPSYKVVDNVITKNEQVLFNSLSEIAKEMNCILTCKSRMIDIINVGMNKKYENSFKYSFYKDFIIQKHFDFCLIDTRTQNYYPKICVELDDVSHYNENTTLESVKSQITKDIICSYCKMPLLRLDDSSIEKEKLHELIEITSNSKTINYHYSSDSLKKFLKVIDKLNIGSVSP